MVVVYLECVLQNTSIPRLSFNSKIDKSKSYQQILEQQIHEFKNQLFVVKENIQEYMKAVPSVDTVYKLVIGSKLNLWTILAKS